MKDKRDLFKFLLEQVEERSNQTGRKEPQAFVDWFARLYYSRPVTDDFFVSDGAGDGKVDAFFSTNDGREVAHHLINSKFTKTYDKLAPPNFYSEIVNFDEMFKSRNKKNFEEFLDKAVSKQLRARYQRLYEFHQDGLAELVFITNCRANQKQLPLLKGRSTKVFHLADILQFIIDDIDGAMPKTNDLVLRDIQSLLSASSADTEVPTSIVFARLVDFIEYMKDDQFDRLFVRNVRVQIKSSAVNAAIAETFKNNPKEFVYSNNGITILCDKKDYRDHDRELHLENPRVVNGSQTLHTIRAIRNPSTIARAMVRIIEIPPISDNDPPESINWKKNVLSNIAVRSNQQNAIKSWNLVSNDDFQMELFRYFRRQGLYYERRVGEWALNSKFFTNNQLRKGPTIKLLTQLIASYYRREQYLGPGHAKLSVARLFEGDVYRTICSTTPEHAHQIYLISLCVSECFNQLAKSKKTFRLFKRHINLSLVALVFHYLEESGADFGSPEFTQSLESHRERGVLRPEPLKYWKRITESAASEIISHYKTISKQTPMTYNNFFKQPNYVAPIFTPRVSSITKSDCKKLN